jgi:TetR/AcrR family transcriptional regulator, transcriptional repressor of bet genes
LTPRSASAQAELPAASAAPPVPAAGRRPGRTRARQRLIDACISALHIYGPSRTTVSRVVALAGLSPGIVRFYFHSKAAMLVAALEYLAAEFEARVLRPVAALRHSPVAALGLLVELYLDAEIASPRKVSVWYSFWGEASSRQEYLEICGKKDEEFAALVHDLVGRLIAQTGAAHLDADGVALGLIGVLEVLWQGIAFQSEANIDRRALVARALAYLRSVFPGQFPGAPRGRPRRAAGRGP